MTFTLSPRKAQMAQSFFDKYLPGQRLNEVWDLEGHERYLGIPARAATYYANAMFANIFHELPLITEADFEREMKTRIKALHELVTKEQMRYRVQHPELLTKAPETAASFISATSAFFSAQNTFAQKLRSAKIYLRFLPHWLSQPTHQIGGYAVRFKHFSHAETPLSLEISNANGVTIATVGFILAHVRGKPVLKITNFQGKSERERSDLRGLPPTKAKRIRAAEYERLSKALGEGWRSFFLKKIVEIAKKKGMTIEGEMPQRFYQNNRAGQLTPLVSEREFQRQKTAYTTAYTNAGMKRVKGTKVWRLEI